MDGKRFEIEVDEDLLATYAAYANSIKGYELALDHYKNQLELIEKSNDPFKDEVLKTLRDQLSVLSGLCERMRALSNRLFPIIKPILDEELPPNS